VIGKDELKWLAEGFKLGLLRGLVFTGGMMVGFLLTCPVWR
jgi:hypothetical protein